METFGFMDEKLGCLLDELAVLAAGQQRARGMRPTRWKLKWRTTLSVQVALHVAAAILRVLPCQTLARLVL